MDIRDYMQKVGRQAREASRATARASTATKNAALLAMAGAIRRQRAELLAANAADVAEATSGGLDAAMIETFPPEAETFQLVTRFIDLGGVVARQQRRGGVLRLAFGLISSF